ncbi:Xanthine dehydrogenase iron-sulfur subunit / Xanthine dehydrogenase, FAD binding subunit [hydrothermal vent metagenome]|uniref:Xanthine dehydrogenase iron-sulfur subunit / Xanthine dehydrogenase, FAD binding subunit n=1 Tax=hydrothermal vent metagenome TaxID=652676 RepID=A0A3B1C900_9ZZZZ
MAQKISFILNNAELSIESATGKTLLDFIRKDAKLTGTKEGCREGDCGACTVMIGEIVEDELHYKTVNSCLYPIGKVNGKHVVTIEGISSDELSPVQNAYAEENASQCGFCTPGFIISTTGYLLENNEPNLDSAINAVAGNVCRCTGYVSIKRALNDIVEEMDVNDNSDNIIPELISKKIIPEYFGTIKERLRRLEILELKESSKTLIVGGGTDLYVQREDDLKNEDPVFISIDAAEKIYKEGDSIFIAGSTTFEELAHSEAIKEIIPNIEETNRLIASLPIRNSATVAGNIVNASPIADITIILLVLNALVYLNDDDKKRTISLTELFLGYKTLAKSETEIIEKIGINIPEGKSLFNFEKVSKRTHLDIASVNSAFIISLEENKIKSCGLSIGGAAPIPLFMKETSAFLEGKNLSAEAIKDALKIIDKEISPISDVRGSAEYKRLLAKQMFKSHFMKLFPNKISMGSFE